MANKFKISLKITGFELQIEGSRDEVPLLAQAVGQQLTGMFMPAADLIEGEVVEVTPPLLSSGAEPTRKPNKKRLPRQKSHASANSKSGVSTDDETVDWVHDPLKWGYPKQDWNTATKAIWLLYVVSKEHSISELTARKITNTFNKHFRESGQISIQYVARDLGKKKTVAPAVVGTDTTKTPATWFLTTAGNTVAENLVANALGRTQTIDGASKEV